jgi:SSS family solute:Na+ symporter
MLLSTLDWSFIVAFFILSLAIGLIVSRQSGRSSTDFFLSGRNMPWWLLGVSMVATTFSADTPNLVTDLVRKDGVSGNWVWWAFLVTGMLTVFVYARLWRRSGIMTDLEFYELRYSGKEAAFLRGFRAIYLGVIFNILIMATVCLAAIKIGSTLLGISPIQTLLLSSLVTVVYSTIGGLRGIILTDFFQFILAMIGTIWAAIVIVNLPEIGGLTNLVQHENVVDKMSILPDFNNTEAFVSLLIIPLAVQWWASYYPGAEPGGGGYIVQRMLAAKDERNAIGATLLFNIAHYALRPWPWIIIALSSLIVFPDLAAIQTAFPNIDPSVIDDDLAYSAMLTYLPKGLLGLVIASLIAAFMSTISTHLNWGSSYIVNDFYKRFIKPDASEKEQVVIGRISTIVLMIIAAILALYLKSAKDAFGIIILMGAGTGLLFILRWFWWRINAYSEITAMIVSFVVALVFKFAIPGMFAGHIELLISVGITTVSWIVVTYLTSAVDSSTLLTFYQLIRPHSMGWQPVIRQGLESKQLVSSDISTGRLPKELMAMFAGIFLVYSILAATGFWLYGRTGYAVALSAASLIWAYVLSRAWRTVV